MSTLDKLEDEIYDLKQSLAQASAEAESERRVREAMEEALRGVDEIGSIPLPEAAAEWVAEHVMPRVNKAREALSLARRAEGGKP